MRRAIDTSMSPMRYGVIALSVIALAVYYVFHPVIPFQHHYEIKAVFTNSTLMRPTTPVRIAGIDVGQVVKTERYKNSRLALVTMRIEDAGRPVHVDATMKIRSRLFLEGNNYVDLRPGTAGAREVPNGGMIPVTQTARPVQVDEVLKILDTDTRASLQKTVVGLGGAFSSPPTGADDAAQDPAVRGLTGAQALNKTFDTSPESLRDSAIVNNALLGPNPHDLSRTIAGFAKATKALSASDQQLRDLVTNFNIAMATMAAHAPDLDRTVALLGPTATNALHAFTSLTRSMPPTREFARALLPAVKDTPATIAASRPWLAQAKPLFGPRELGGLLHELSPATSDLAMLGHETRLFLPRIDRFNRCAVDVLLPTGNVKVQDGAHSAGVESYKEFWSSFVGQAGEIQGFDGNGSLFRIAAPGGSTTIETGKTKFDGGPLFANPALPPLSTRPAFPNQLPPLRRDVACHTQPVPDVNGPASQGPADGSRPHAPSPRPLADPGVLMDHGAAAPATRKAARR